MFTFLTERAALALTLTLLVLVSWLADPHPTEAQSPAPVQVSVQITDSGFACETKTANCVGDENGIFTLEFDQGSVVELKVVWANKAYTQEEHIIVIEGYKLETDKLDSKNREALLKFVADKPGTFAFKCDLDCDVHEHLQKGEIRIKRSGGSGAPTLTETKLMLTPSSTILAGGEWVTLMATLKDSAGEPVSKAQVHFSIDTDFVGTTGKMVIGTAKTDANGVAFLDYQPTLNSEQQTINAQFEGMGLYSESQEKTAIQVVGSPYDAYRTGPIGTESIARFAAGAFLFILLGVWTTYGFVASQVLNITRDR